MIWNRERYLAHCHHQYTGRELFCEYIGPMKQLEDEWRRQGVSAKEIDLTAFDWDYVLMARIECSVFPISGKNTVVLEDNPEYTISIDELGRKMKLIKKSATLPLPLDHPVKTMDDWQKIKHWYEFSEDRVNKEELLKKKALYDKGYLTVFEVLGGFDAPRQLLGEENLCLACYDEPEMLEDMLTTMTDTAVKVMERIGDIVPIDTLFIHEDMAGKSGPLFGPKQISEFLAPYYKKIWDCAKNYGATLFAQDSDGNMNSVIDAFLDCGVNFFYPLEPAAGMDIVEVRKKYGKQMCMMGGIDKLVLREDKAAIRAELEYKMSGPTRGGGTIFTVDHQIPNGVPIENYRYYVETGREILGLEPISGEGWGRCSFARAQQVK